MSQNAASAQDSQALAYAKKGIILAALSGLIFSADGLFIKSTETYSPFDRPELWLLIPLVCAGIHDLCAGIIITVINWRSGRFREIWRSLRSRPGRYVIAGALIGALFGMGGYMVALQMAGPAYVLPITSMYPAVAAVMAVFVLKERITTRAWAGLLLCVFGAVAVGYTPPDGQAGNVFYWGLFFAALSAVGWGVEGVWVTLGMDFIEPIVALNIYYLVSAVLFLVVLIPPVAIFMLPEHGGILAPAEFLQSKGIMFVAVAGCLGTMSYLCWYKSMNMTGVSRAMALNISYALWGIVLSSIFTEIKITATLIIGALIIFGGMVMVIGNPRDMLNLRKTG